MARIETPKRIRGTQDIFGEEQRRFATVIDAFDRVRRLYCFQRLDRAGFRCYRELRDRAALRPTPDADWRFALDGTHGGQPVGKRHDC